MARWAGVMIAVGLASAAAHAQQTPPAAATKLDKTKLSYAIGYQIGSQFADGDPAATLCHHR